MCRHKCDTTWRLSSFSYGFNNQEVNLVNCKINKMTGEASEGDFWGGFEVTSHLKTKRMGDVETKAPEQEIFQTGCLPGLLLRGQHSSP